MPEPRAYSARSRPVQARTSYSSANATVTTSNDPNIEPTKKKTPTISGTPA